MIEFEKEFQSITKTEHFNAIKYEDFTKMRCYVFNPDSQVEKQIGIISAGNAIYLGYNLCVNGSIYGFAQTIKIYRNNKDNYEKACIFAKKVFLGDEI